MEIDDIINPGVKKIKPYIPGTPIIEVLRKYGIKKPIKMNSNENAIGTSKKAIRKAKKILYSAHIYPDPSNRKLIDTIGSLYNIPSDFIAVGNGADELIYYISMVFINDGDNAIIPEITFPIYETSVKIMRGNVKRSKMKGIKIDTDDILKNIDSKTKLIFFCNPNNPTGDAIESDEFLNFFKRIPENVIVVVDEAYSDFRETNNFPDSITLLKKNHKNIIVIKTMSKSHGFAGLRVGYCFAHKEIIELINRIRLPFNLTYVSQEAAIEALKDVYFYKKTISTISKGKKKLYYFFDKMNLNYVRSHTNYILVDTGIPAEKITEKLMERGVLVRNAAPYGFPTSIRVTIGTEKQNRIFMKKFKEVFDSLKNN